MLSVIHIQTDCPGHELCWAAWQSRGTWPVQIAGPNSACMHDLNTSEWQMVRELARAWLWRRGWGMAWLVVKITLSLKTFISSVSLAHQTCYLKIDARRNSGKPFDFSTVCIRHTLTTDAKNTFHPPYPEKPIALAGICDPNPYFNFPPLMQTNSILVAFSHQRSATGEMGFFSCGIHKKTKPQTFWVISCRCQLCPSKLAPRPILGFSIEPLNIKTSQ